MLVVEVADTTMDYDRDRKGSLYARAGVQDYWILNLTKRHLDVYREPEPSADTPFGWTYKSVRLFGPGDQVSPLVLPAAPVAIDDLLA